MGSPERVREIRRSCVGHHEQRTSRDGTASASGRHAPEDQSGRSRADNSAVRSGPYRDCEGRCTAEIFPSRHRDRRRSGYVRSWITSGGEWCCHGCGSGDRRCPRSAIRSSSGSTYGSHAACDLRRTWSYRRTRRRLQLGTTERKPEIAGRFVTISPYLGGLLADGQPAHAPAFQRITDCT